MRYSEVVFAWVHSRRERWIVAELGEAEGGEDADDVGVVREIEVEGLIEREGLRVAVEGCVDL